MPIIQPGIGGGIHGRSVSARCGQGGHSELQRPGRGAGVPRRNPIFTATIFTGNFGISGVTKDSAGVALPGVSVAVYSQSQQFLAETVSDGAGAYSFTNIGVGSVFVVAYLAGAPDVAGTTVNNIAPVQVG